jgi:DNA polymerase I
MSVSGKPVQNGDHVFLVDGSSYIFRAYHALPPLTRKSDGLPVGAVSGFCNMLWKLLRDTIDGEKPTHLAVIFDASSKTFRNDLYDGYKAHRPEPPEDLRPQFKLIRHAVRAFDIASIEQEGFEADDLIATYAEHAAQKGATVTIVASDKDLMQLVNNVVTLYDSMKDKRIGADEVMEKFGVAPDRVADVQALAGDSVDNVPGVPGIGLKTAAQLITEFGDLENLLNQAASIKQNKRRESLIEHAAMARLSKQLVVLDKNVPLHIPLDDLAIHEPEPKNLIAFLKALNFNTLTRRVAETYNLDISLVEPQAALLPGGADLNWQSAAKEAAAKEGTDTSALPSAQPYNQAAPSPQTLAAARIEAALKQPFDTSAYDTVIDLDALDRWIAAARETGFVALDTETTSLDSMQAELIGFSLCVAPGKACYVPLQHRGSTDLFGGGLLKGQIALPDAIARLKSLCGDASILKIGQNLKYDLNILARYGIACAPIDDTMLLSYVLDAGRGTHNMDDLSERHLVHKTIAYKDVTGSGKTARGFAEVSLAEATAYAAEDADVTFRLWLLLKARLVAEQKVTVYETLERPLLGVIARMEQNGIAIDRAILSRMSGEFAHMLGALESEIHELAGEAFTIGSPKQLGDILFGKMGFAGAKKTASGQWATGAGVLEELAEQGHALPAKILEWRQLSKLKSTYTDALPHYIHPQTKRIHTSFSLAATTTGRLSSSDPNLQNIPIRTEAGRKIRTAFIAEQGLALISADYSQIELRLLAHIADIPQLTKAFADGIDIHAMTASEMFGVPVKDMDPMIRRRAKAINFGIIYGISAFGLANQLGIGREEAGAYIKQYFERFPGIRAYMEDTKRFCREHGYVTTIFGRVCHYPGIASASGAERAFVERQAINAPIQGSASDIIRRAMIRIEDALQTAKLSTRMLLQVHDELVFETPLDEAEAALPIIRRVMVDAPLPALALKVPLIVEARAAQNWEAAH